MNKKEIASSLKVAGGFIAWMIGSGFATGQEILRFFSAYGAKSIFVLAANLIGFAVVGIIILKSGFLNKETVDFNHYEFYCGRIIGRAYSVVVPITLILMMSVLISASGATFEQYYSINRYLGSVVMAVLVLAAYLIGFERMLKTVSFISPVVIAFVVTVGIVTVVRDGGAAANLAASGEALSGFRSCPHWTLSALLYISLNFLCGSTYYNALGMSSKSKKSIVIGVLIGTAALMITISAICFAMLFNAESIAQVSVPVLYLAETMSKTFGTLFSVILILGMFASCSTMMWSFCSGFFRTNKKKNSIFAILTAIVCLSLGLFPFGNLVAVIYPLIGYAGIIFIVCVIYKGIRRKKK